MDPEAFAAAYVALHNAASKEYRAAFKKVGARMWYSDKAHPLKADNQAFIAQQVASGFTEYELTRPLTVLDSYPKVKFSAKRQELDREVDKIHQRYQALWHQKREELSNA